MTASRIITAFIAGALAVLVFHQGAVFALHAAGVVSWTAWSLTSTEPFGVPQVLSSAFFGGLWGIVLAFVLGRIRRETVYWLVAALFGSIVVTAVAIVIVLPIKGVPTATIGLGGGLMGLVVNGAWGLGTAWLLRILGKGR